MKKLALELSITLIALSGMAHAATHEHDTSHHQTAMQIASSSGRHEGSGIVKGVNTQAGKVQIAHQPIPGLGWPSMTMWFTLRSPLLQDIKVGDSVGFELVQEGKQWVIVSIKRK